MVLLTVLGPICLVAKSWGTQQRHLECIPADRATSPHVGGEKTWLDPVAFSLRFGKWGIFGRNGGWSDTRRVTPRYRGNGIILSLTCGWISFTTQTELTILTM